MQVFPLFLKGFFGLRHFPLFTPRPEHRDMPIHGRRLPHISPRCLNLQRKLQQVPASPKCPWPGSHCSLWSGSKIPFPQGIVIEPVLVLVTDPVLDEVGVLVCDGVFDCELDNEIELVTVGTMLIETVNESDIETLPDLVGVAERDLDLVLDRDFVFERERDLLRVGVGLGPREPILVSVFDLVTLVMNGAPNDRLGVLVFDRDCPDIRFDAV